MRKGRILIVEDETDVLDANRIYLENEGYEVVCAINLKEAHNIVWEKPPDIILLDVLLPDGSGYDFCKEIRKLTAAPIIFLTCMDSTDNIKGGFSLGADDYITKPYNMDILNARIAARLRSSNFQQGGIITLPPLKINLHIGKVWMNGKEIALSMKEIQLLAFFAENIGREFMPDEIYQNVWGEEPIASNNTVRVHISNLRSKLRLFDEAFFEITLTPSRGYSFIRTKAEV